MEISQLVDKAIHAAVLAGKKIMEVYASVDFGVVIKEDQTPVTIADRQAHNEIIKYLESAGLPVLSEEGIHLSYSERKNWDMFWLIDPLDGTKEFIKRNDEFTVNIALIQNGRPIAGVIFAPVTSVLYVGIPETGAFKLVNPDEHCTFQSMQLSGKKLPEETGRNEFAIVVSRSHMNQKTKEYIENIREEHESFRLINMGSSMKMCMVAEGTASVYPKLGTTMEWDTAAGHAILKASGKNIFITDLKTEIRYNKENLQNPHFIAL